MKVISLLQPWATLVVIGAKQIETRSWNTKYRGPLLIHASSRISKETKELTLTEPFATALRELQELPLGCIIGSVNLTSTSQSEYFSRIGPTGRTPNWEREKHFGDFSPGRYGWLLADPLAFSNHFHCRGALGIWTLDYRICLSCGCTDIDCRACIEKTSSPCRWVDDNLCSACLA